jgi:hypothetical protein
MFDKLGLVELGFDDFVGLGDWVLCCFDEYCIWNFSVWL